MSDPTGKILVSFVFLKVMLEKSWKEYKADIARQLIHV